MIALVAKRLLLLLPVVWIVTTLVFGLVHMVPGDPVAQMLGEGAAVTEIERMRHDLGLDRSIAEQYATYMGGLVQGNMGLSIRNRIPVAEAIGKAYPATLELAAGALVFSLILALPMGLMAAVRRGRTIDRVIGIISLVGMSMPNFALGPILILVFSIGLGWLPVSGRGDWTHLLLPAGTLGAALAAITTRMTRSSIIEELGRDYVRTARAKGLGEPAILLRHAFRNGLVPIVTILGLQAGSLLAGAIVTETVFSWPGLGRLTIQAINARDYPLIQGCILTIALSYILINLLTDALYALADPRIRHE